MFIFKFHTSFLGCLTTAALLLTLGCSSQPASTPTAAPAKTPQTTAAYKDGVYEGTGQGYSDKIKVRVTVKDHRVAAIDIISQNESPRAYGNAKDEMLQRLLKTQNPVKADAVSGATFTSNGIRYAVADALKDQLSPADYNTIKAEAETNEPLRVKTKAANDKRHQKK